MKAYLDMKEIQQLENMATSLRDRLLIRLLARLGCRVSEALALKVDDIDFNRGTVTILHLKERLRLSCPNCRARLGRNHCYCPQCGAQVEKSMAKVQQTRRIRTLPLDGETLDMLRDFVNRSGVKGLVFGINRHRTWQIIHDCARKAGLPSLVHPETGKIKGISPHRLRDSFAVHAVKVDDSGDSLRLLQEHLGHQSITTTMRYRKISGEEQKKWYERLWNK
jgi:integrase/recombinase XerD